MSIILLCRRRTVALSVIAAADKIGISWQTPQTDPMQFRKRIADAQPHVALITDDYLDDPALFTDIRAVSPKAIIAICLTANRPPDKRLWNLLDNLEFDVLITIEELPKCLESLKTGRFCQSSLLEAHVGYALNESFAGSNELTPAERRVLKLMVEGKTGAEIANGLYISKKTVNNHKNNIAQKLNVRGGPGSLTRFVLTHNLPILALLI